MSLFVGDLSNNKEELGEAGGVVNEGLSNETGNGRSGKGRSMRRGVIRRELRNADEDLEAVCKVEVLVRMSVDIGGGMRMGNKFKEREWGVGGGVRVVRSGAWDGGEGESVSNGKMG